ncbi:MAG TPA: NAD-dependent epimerase/dehydratase family protein [Caulobacteraceae bacterium]|nr:NAD-dependent epimerase/dehydratase family protein [Caulobacteraceae bacterium]
MTPTTRRTLVQMGALGLTALAWPEPLLAAQRAVNPMRILILGGTGFTGPHQVRYALARGHTVTTFNRGREKMDWPGPVEELIGDRNTGDLKALEGREWDVCIDNPTTLPKWVRDAGQVLQGKVKQYIFISTISVYAANDTPNADETAALVPYTGKDAFAESVETMRSTPELYGSLKALSEKEAEHWFPGETTVIRPGLIVGPGDETDRFTYWPVRLARGGEVLAPGDGGDPVQFIDARDLAEWTIRMAEQRTFGVFNGNGPAHPLDMRGMLEGIERGVQTHPELVWVSTKFLDAENVNAWSDMPVWVPGQGDTAGFHRRDHRRAIGAGLTFRPVPVTAADTLAWFKTLPADRQAKLRSGLTADREAALLAKWKASQHA